MKNKYLTLNIQMFAEEPTDGGTNGGSTVQENTITKEDYDKLASELAKYKQANDNLSKENANYKRSAKEKMSEDEKKAQALKEQQEDYNKLKTELLSMKMTKELSTCGFDNKQCEDIISSFTQGDMVNFAKTISTKVNEMVEKKIKEEQAKFQASSTVPPGSGGKTTSNDFIESLFKNKNEKNSARDYYLKK